MEKVLGVMGGLGFEAGLGFCLSAGRKAAARSGTAPHILLDSIALPRRAMEDFARGGKPQEGKDALLESIHRFNCAGASFVAIPCNTVHVFINEMRADSAVPVLSIIEETSAACKMAGAQGIALLATSGTIQGRLYHAALSQAGIAISCLGNEEQAELDGIIIRINCLEGTERDYARIAELAESLAAGSKADLVVLGCTDLSPAAGKIRAHGIKAIDSLEELENKAVSLLLGP